MFTWIILLLSFTLKMTFAESFVPYPIHDTVFQLSGQFTEGELLTLKSDLELLKKIPATTVSSPIHSSIFGGPVSGEVYFKWFTDRIKTFAKGRNKNLKKFPFVAEHVFGKSKSEDQINIILLYKNYFLEKNPYLRLATLIHEARHADGKNMDHTKCPPYYIESFKTDKLNRVTLAPVCDQTWEGSYGAELVFLFYLKKALGQNITELEPEQSMAAGRITDVQSRCELNVDFWPEQFSSIKDCHEHLETSCQ